MQTRYRAAFGVVVGLLVTVLLSRAGDPKTVLFLCSLPVAFFTGLIELRSV